MSAVPAWMGDAAEASPPVAPRGWRALSDRQRGWILALSLLLLLAAVAVVLPWLAPYDPAAIKLSARLRPPVWEARGTWSNVLGTDNLGRDVLSRILHGARLSILIGAAVVAVSATFGVLVGLVAGFAGGRVDAALMRWVDVHVAFPGLLLSLVILVILGPGPGTVILALALNGWMVYARQIRSVVLSVRQLPYIESAEMAGARAGRILLRHILPNLAAPLITLMVLEFARVVLAEAALSFLGVGVQPPAVSWGLDVANGRNYLTSAWWLATFPGLSIALTVLIVNVAASRLRLALDPREREKDFARRLIAKVRR
ncbi:ABC transporter permease [Achromobacter marplatensis]|uniref:Peptide/nickel transport system permease protein n=1 Tax=Achromobacter marplatensis TaxID=470868 RepID=A0ABX9GLC9_9BURK|nr:ABC transporter permease [Achromobacter marplatensis]RBP24133.1 peptide/nickel transport system permease protein [Achromobacter marplatensis]CAB3628207.1 putative D,D-dipeptide transport system permease protein DdpC [Achromobacter marplatensis]